MLTFAYFDGENTIFSPLWDFVVDLIASWNQRSQLVRGMIIAVGQSPNCPAHVIRIKLEMFFAFRIYHAACKIKTVRGTVLPTSKKNFIFSWEIVDSNQ